MSLNLDDTVYRRRLARWFDTYLIAGPSRVGFDWSPTAAAAAAVSDMTGRNGGTKPSFGIAKSIGSDFGCSH